MGPAQKNESALEWLTKNMGFVDKVCCYSYSERNVFHDEASIEVDMRSAFVPQSWSLDEAEEAYILDSNSTVQPHQSNYFAREGKIGKTNHQHLQKRQGLGKENLSSRSLGTRSTATTSSTTTVVTSGRIRAFSGGSSIESSSQSPSFPHQDHFSPSRHCTYESKRKQPKPVQIYCHAHSDGELNEGSTLRPVNSRSFPSVPFSSATEGYPC